VDFYGRALAVPLRVPTFEETTACAIEACEAAWEFFGGLFKVLIPDNTKAIVIDPDPLAPRITPAFLEYAQARHFHIDAARVRLDTRQVVGARHRRAQVREQLRGKGFEKQESYPSENRQSTIRRIVWANGKPTQ
jgi:hypothetical protein